MIGSIIGDVIGSIYERNNIKIKSFPLFSENCHFTDDTILTIAVADSILNNRTYHDVILEYVKKYPNYNYGSHVHMWREMNGEEQGFSWGNGAAMRVGPVGWAFPSMEKVLEEARKSAECTHNDPDAINGTLATASAIYLGRNCKAKNQIKDFIEDNFEYDLNIRLNELRKTYKLDLSSKGTVIPALISFLESDNFEDAIRNAISLGGDSDTLACITGSIAQAFYKEIPAFIIQETRNRLLPEFLNIINRFEEKYIP